MRDDRTVSQEERALSFYFGAMSPYSWFAAERIERLLPQARWRGVFAGAVFKANGRSSWGLDERRDAGIADCDARAAELRLGPISWPDPWPTNDLLVARAMAYCARADAAAGEGGDALMRSYGLAAMRLAFLEGVDIGERDAVLEAGRRVGIDERLLGDALQDQQVKETTRALTDEAVTASVFGVPTVLVGKQVFWGDDRLSDAASAYREAQAAG
jgi:2-hydroxychromene-2-carboxylate isomerase